MGESRYKQHTARQREIVMGDRLSGSIVTVAIAAAAVGAAISTSVTQISAQAPAASGAAVKTSWGEPDLQGIWTDEFDTPLQRPGQYANQEFFTEAQRAELDQSRAAGVGPLSPQRGSKGAYKTAAVFFSKQTRARTTQSR